MPPTLEEDRRREADRLRSELPSRPLTRRETEILQADPDYEIYWVRGRYVPSDREVATQFAVRFDRTHAIAFNYRTASERWETIGTGHWPRHLPAIDRDLNRVASPAANWHEPLTARLE